MNQKSQLRAECRKRRRELSDDQQSLASHSFSQLFQASPYYHHQSVACYMAQDGELDVMPLMHGLWASGKTCLLPVIGSENRLTFSQYRADSKMQPNRYQILEPVGEPVVALCDIDIILMPLVGFDRHGNRLGMGAGYYDRALMNHRPRLLGVAHDCQEVDQIPVDEWDVPLNAVMTDTQLIEVVAE